MSRRHEQKHLLHNRSYCRYCDCPQSPRVVLGITFARELCRANLSAIASEWNLHSFGSQPELSRPVGIAAEVVERVVRLLARSTTD